MLILLGTASLYCLALMIICAVTVVVSAKLRSFRHKRSGGAGSITSSPIDRLLVTTSVFLAVLTGGLAILLFLDVQGWLSPADTGLDYLPYRWQLPACLFAMSIAVLTLLPIANRVFSPKNRFAEALGHVLSTRLLSIIGAVVTLATCYLVAKTIFADFREFPERTTNITVRSPAGVLQHHPAVQLHVDGGDTGVVIELSARHAGYVLVALNHLLGPGACTKGAIDPLNNIGIVDPKELFTEPVSLYPWQIVRSNTGTTATYAAILHLDANTQEGLYCALSHVVEDETESGRRIILQPSWQEWVGTSASPTIMLGMPLGGSHTSIDMHAATKGGDYIDLRIFHNVVRTPRDVRKINGYYSDEAVDLETSDISGTDDIHLEGHGGAQLIESASRVSSIAGPSGTIIVSWNDARGEMMSTLVLIIVGGALSLGLGLYVIDISDDVRDLRKRTGAL